MTARDAAEFLQYLTQQELEVYVDGGWAVDALLGEPTREHRDLDIAVPEKHVPKLRELMSRRGFREAPRPDTWECNFVLADSQGRELDVHSYTLDEAGNNVHGVAYRAEHLTGSGVIDGYAVRCVAPEWLVNFHTGYPIDETDYRDVSALCKRFGLALPEEYQKFLR